MIKVMPVIEKYPKLIWGAIAVGIYLFVVGVLIFYFNTREEKKPKHYVKKDEHRIQVALASPKNIQKKNAKTPKITKPKPQNKPKFTVKPKVKPKPKKVAKKKLIKEKVVKKSKTMKVTKKKTIKKKDENLTKPKKKKTIDLFAKVKTLKKKNLIQISDKPVKTRPTKNIIKVTDAPASATQRISDSIKKQKSMDSGEVNTYFAKVQAMLEAWPARSEFLGEEATVTLFIKPTGKFEYQVTSGSDNVDFGKSVVDFLNQLQRLGFGRHNAGRTYEFEVEFSTKE